MTRSIPALVAACTVLSACGPSRAQIEAEATAALQKSIDDNSAYRDLGVHAGPVKLVHDRDNHWDGVSSVTIDGKSRNISVHVTAAAGRTTVSTDPGAFSFADQKLTEQAFRRGPAR